METVITPGHSPLLSLPVPACRPSLKVAPAALVPAPRCSTSTLPPPSPRLMCPSAAACACLRCVCSTRAKKYFLVLMVGGTAALPQAKGLDGGEPDEEGQQEVYVGHRKTKRRKGGHGDKVRSPV